MNPTPKAQNPDAEKYLEPLDSSLIAVKASASALHEKSFQVTESYPSGIAPLLKILSYLPETYRIRGIEWGVSGRGLSPATLPEVNVESFARWCVSQYPAHTYPAILVGAPSGAAAHLSALLSAPLLTTHFLLSIQHHKPLYALPEVLRFGRQWADQILKNYSDIQIFLHFDPVHDAFLVKYLTHLRLKFSRLPDVYQDFIRSHLAPDGSLILLNIRYPWRYYRISDNLILQVGGLGGISPETFLKEYPLPHPVEEGPESEWGTPTTFVEDTRQFASRHSIPLVELSYPSLEPLSQLAHSLYLQAFPSRDILIDCFTYIDPYTNIASQIPGLWLPFHCTDSYSFLTHFLEGLSFRTIYLALVPSFARAPDTVPLKDWLHLLSAHGRVHPLGISSRYPSDPYAVFNFVKAMKALRPTQPGSFTPLPVEILKKTLFNDKIA